MPRRLNYTNRRSIGRENVSIQVRQDSSGATFDAELKLDGCKASADTRVFVEAFRSASTTWKRFDFGRVGCLIPPADRRLDEFGDPAGIRFRVKLTSADGAVGKLVAEEDDVQPRLPDDKDRPSSPLIVIAPGAIGNEIWRVSFDGALPTLLINEQIGDWKVLAKDWTFRALVTPAVMRQVLTNILIVDGDIGDEDDATDWRGLWLRFAERLPGVAETPTPPTDVADRPACEEWINTAVEAFSKAQAFLPHLQEARSQESRP